MGAAVPGARAPPAERRAPASSWLPEAAAGLLRGSHVAPPGPTSINDHVLLNSQKRRLLKYACRETLGISFTPAIIAVRALAPVEFPCFELRRRWLGGAAQPLQNPTSLQGDQVPTWPRPPPASWGCERHGQTQARRQAGRTEEGHGADRRASQARGHACGPQPTPAASPARSSPSVPAQPIAV